MRVAFNGSAIVIFMKTQEADVVMDGATAIVDVERFKILLMPSGSLGWYDDDTFDCVLSLDDLLIAAAVEAPQDMGEYLGRQIVLRITDTDETFEELEPRIIRKERKKLITRVPRDFPRC